MSKFAQLASKLEALKAVPAKIAEVAKIGIEASIQAEFDGGNDLYGRPWKQLKIGGASKLQQSGALRSSLKVQIDGTAIEISFSDYKFAFHQATRPILTIGVMPEKWSLAIEQAFANVMNQR